MSRSVVSETIKKHKYFALICTEMASILEMVAILNVKNKFLGLVNI